jgi:hypothetical protein
MILAVFALFFKTCPGPFFPRLPEKEHNSVTKMVLQQKGNSKC